MTEQMIESRFNIERLAPDTIRIERLLDAPVETVWRYLTDPELRGEWFAGGPIEERRGGALDLTFDHDNLSTEDVPYPEDYAKYKGAVSHEKVVRFEPPSVFAFTFGEGKQGTATFELSAQGNRTRLVLTHSGIQSGTGDVDFGSGWNSHLAVLEGLLSGKRVRNFWALHKQSQAAVAKQLA